MNIDQAFEYSLMNLDKLGFDGMREPERVLATIWAIEAEINNGGFDQLFYNTAGDISFYAVVALKSIGANKMAKISEDALSIFGVDGPPKDGGERRDKLNSFGAKHEDLLDHLSYKFTEYPDNLQELLAEYVQEKFK